MSTRREADNLGGSVLLLQHHGERLTCQLERRPCERRDVAAAGEGAEDEKGLPRAELGGDALLGAERLARPKSSTETA